MVRPTADIDRFEEMASEVFEPLQRYLLRRAPRQDAEDALSEVMLTIWRRLGDIPPDRVLPWCYGVARHTLANQRRGRRRGLSLVEKLRAEPISHQIDLSESDGDPGLQTALQSLGEADREILRLWAWEQLEPREIATVMGLTVNAATLRLSRARKRLGERLSGQDSAPAGHRRVKGNKEHRDE